MNLNLKKLAMIIVMFFLAHVAMSAAFRSEELQNTKKTYPSQKVADFQND